MVGAEAQASSQSWENKALQCSRSLPLPACLCGVLGSWAGSPGTLRLPLGLGALLGAPSSTFLLWLSPASSGSTSSAPQRPPSLGEHTTSKANSQGLVPDDFQSKSQRICFLSQHSLVAAGALLRLGAEQAFPSFPSWGANSIHAKYDFGFKTWRTSSYA